MRYILFKLIFLSLLIGTSFAQEELFIEDKSNVKSGKFEEKLARLKELKTSKNVKVTKINGKAFKGETLQITLPDNKKLKLKKSNLRSSVKTRALASLENWNSEPNAEDNLQGNFTINSEKNTVNGTIRYGLGQEHHVYLLLPLDDEGNHALVEQDWRVFGND